MERGGRKRNEKSEREKHTKKRMLVLGLLCYSVYAGSSECLVGRYSLLNHMQ